MTTCAFLGLGIMGYHMAGHLDVSVDELRVWNRSPSKRDKWGETFNGIVSSSIEGAVVGADFVIMCVGDDSDVYSVFDQVIKYVKPETIIIDHTTTSENCAEYCYNVALKNSCSFIDAPVSGGESGAINGTLTAMCGGDEEVFSRSLDVISNYCKSINLMGGSGSGQLTKMVNQICIAGVLQGLAEGVYFAQKADLDIEKVIEAIGKGAAQSWQMDNRAITMGRDEYNFGFAVDHMRKDLSIVLKASKKFNISLSLVEMVDEFYSELQSTGGGRLDTSSLLKRLK
jgi:3-hydroxyisobutyrate dehydrogenase-like beta-hydroxyacid dehydrogenase